VGIGLLEIGVGEGAQPEKIPTTVRNKGFKVIAKQKIELRKAERTSGAATNPAVATGRSMQAVVGKSRGSDDRLESDCERLTTAAAKCRSLSWLHHACLLGTTAAGLAGPAALMVTQHAHWHAHSSPTVGAAYCWTTNGRRHVHMESAYFN